MNYEKRDAIRMAKKNNLRVDGLESTRTSHYRLTVTNQFGDSAFFIPPSSSSSVRGTKNFEAGLRKFSRGLLNPKRHA